MLTHRQFLAKKARISRARRRLYARRKRLRLDRHDSRVVSLFIASLTPLLIRRILKESELNSVRMHCTDWRKYSKKR